MQERHEAPTAPWGPGFGQAPTPPKGSGGRTGLLIAAVVAVVGLSVAGWLIPRDNEEQVAGTLDTLDVTVPNIDDVLSTAPTIPEITIPTIPTVTVPDSVVVDQTAVPVTAAATTVSAPETTLPVPPPATNPFEGTQAGDVIAADAQGNIIAVNQS